jgi:uncharacterized SAM-binding protein YcdF (DUF218 family)
MGSAVSKNGSKRDYVIVFGAAVRSNGKPSAALRRRIRRASEWAARNPTSMIVATGAAGDNGVTEAVAIKEALVADGVQPGRILVEPKGRDTLQSVRLCSRLIRQRGDCGRVVCCTSRYHQPRCALLLRLLGYRVVLPDLPMTRGRLSRSGVARLILREVAALPYDAVLLLAGRKPAQS